MNKNTITARATEFSFDAGITFETQDELQAFIALFPKSVKVYGTLCTTVAGITLPYASFSVSLGSDEVNQGTNETGIKRIRKFVALAVANGYNIFRNDAYNNSLTQEDFDNLVGKVGA